jgi:hypothetical protein
VAGPLPSTPETPGAPGIRQVCATENGLVYEVSAPGERSIDVRIDGRRVWSFKESTAELPADLPAATAPRDHLRFEPWPVVLRRRLVGRFEVELRPVDGGSGAAVTAVLGNPASAPELTDVHGRPLVVNKWGRLGHTIADADPAMIDRMLGHMDEIRDLLQTHLGDRVFVTGGTLLGPTRADGRLIPHDDDADLAYLSSWEHPADVARENFEIGRLLRERGYDAIRLSAAHVQMHFDHDGVPDHYVDVFAGFLMDDMWYQHFAIGTQAGVDRLLPPGTVQVEGRTEPAPRDPEFMLTQLFGPGWRVPDPAFRFATPPSIVHRLNHWFPDIHADREDWEDVVLMAGPAAPPVDDVPSAFADWVDRRTPQDHALLELGSGLGADARALGARGRTVRGVDFSRMCVRAARAGLTEEGVAVTFDEANLLDLRTVLRLGAECAAADTPWTVFGRRLVNALDGRGRDNVFRLCSMLLRRGGTAFFDLLTDPAYPQVPAHQRPGLDQLWRECAVHGLVLEEAERRLEPMIWARAPEEQLVEMTRVALRRRPR